MYRPLADHGIVRRLLGAAAAAPSIHNTQPWRFRVAGHDLIEVHGAPDRMLWVADPRGRALHLSCGAALFNLRLAIRASGAKPLVWPLPDPAGEPTLLASVQLAEGRPPELAERELFESIWQRHSSRAPFSARALPPAVRSALDGAARAEFAALRLLSGSDAALVARLAAAADKELAENFDHRVELCRWVGTEGDDGIPAPALGFRPDREPAPVRDFGYASPTAPRPQGATSHRRTWRCWPPRETSRPTGSGPARRCSGCCLPRPGTGSPPRCSTSRSNCTTRTGRKTAGGPGRSARRSSSGLAMVPPARARPGGRWRTSSTTRNRRQEATRAATAAPGKDDDI